MRTDVLPPPRREQTIAAENGALGLSVVIPVYNERESLPALFDRLLPVLDAVGCTYEVVAVDDGSVDGSAEQLRQAASRYPEVRVITFARNFGQTAALMAGFDHSRGEVVVTLDADLQNDPQDIPALVARLHEGFDVVSGWRVERKDAALSRRLPSWLANRIISRMSGVELKDYGCTLKAYRREVMDGVRLYGEMHRLIPIYASWMGARVVEMPVRHHARQHGASHYGWSRVYKVMLDLLVAKFFGVYLVKPIYVFGGVGLLSILLSFVVLTWALALKLFAATSLIQTPLPLLAAMLFLMGCGSVLMGLLAEIMMRTYFESQDRKPYRLRTLSPARTLL
jgi:glycosyltransferase involved in cell wall biosynthesis